MQAHPFRDASVRSVVCAVALSAIVVGGANAVAQAPEPVANARPVESHLQPLGSLATAGVFSLQPVVAARSVQEPERRPGQDPGAGTMVARLWAVVQDARFHQDGRLLSLLVEPPIVDPRGGGTLRVLPASAVRWDASRRQWALAEANLQLAELEAVGDPRPGRTSVKAPAPGAWLLASHLEKATSESVKVASADTGKEARPVATPAAVLWFSPTAEHLVCLLSPIAAPSPPNTGGVRYVALPWSLVGVTSAGDGCQVRPMPDRDLLAAGPAVADPSEAPTEALRRRAYAHFGLAIPSWESFAGSTK